MKTKTQRVLCLEYCGRVHYMCAAYNKQHNANIMPAQCVKLNGKLWKGSSTHPMFDGDRYDLAVAIIEDTPVFVVDKIYHKAQKHCVHIKDGVFYDPLYWTITPPNKD